VRVLLRHDVEGLGHKGDLLDVADGYGRNYLVPKGFALEATAGVEAQAESMRRNRQIRDLAAREQAEEAASRLVSQPIQVRARAGEGGKLFGSITTADISTAVLEQASVEIDRKTIGLAEPIRSLGTHVAQVQLHADVEFPLTIEVEAEA
jgi:large subunit ribosomal protein L9